MLAGSQPSHVDEIFSPLSPNSRSRVFSFCTSFVVFNLSSIKPSNKPPIRALTSRSVRKHPRSLSHSTRSPQSLSPPTRSHPQSTDAKPPLVPHICGRKENILSSFNLIEGFDLPAIEEKIARYQEENAEQIMINRARKAEELAAALAASKAHPAQNDADGAQNQSSQMGYSIGTQGQYAPTLAGGQPRPTGMAPQPIPLGGGPDMLGYATDDEEMMKLRAERGGRAGGWSAELSKRRALEEAFGSIWIS